MLWAFIEDLYQKKKTCYMKYAPEFAGKQLCDSILPVLYII